MNRAKVRRVNLAKELGYYYNCDIIPLFTFLMLIALAFLACIFFQEACTRIQEWRPPEDIHHQVLRIIEGNTIVIDYHGQKEIIRLLRINTPERKRYGYKQAKEAMAELVSGKSVRLEFEPSGKIRRDRYKRILAYVWIDGLNVNVEMVRLGWSRFWTKYGAGRYAEEFRAAEREARENKWGLWKRR